MGRFIEITHEADNALRIAYKLAKKDKTYDAKSIVEEGVYWYCISYSLRLCLIGVIRNFIITPIKY